MKTTQKQPSKDVSIYHNGVRYAFTIHPATESKAAGVSYHESWYRWREFSEDIRIAQEVHVNIMPRTKTTLKIAAWSFARPNCEFFLEKPVDGIATTYCSGSEYFKITKIQNTIEKIAEFIAANLSIAFRHYDKDVTVHIHPINTSSLSTNIFD